MLYTLDIWCIPTHGEPAGACTVGSAKAIEQITTIQRVGALAITGGLSTSPTDMLDTHTHLLPAALTVNKWCH